jgi:hypothetical protein
VLELFSTTLHLVGYEVQVSRWLMGEDLVPLATCRQMPFSFTILRQNSGRRPAVSLVGS